MRSKAIGLDFKIAVFLTPVLQEGRRAANWPVVSKGPHGSLTPDAFFYTQANLKRSLRIIL